MKNIIQVVVKGPRPDFRVFISFIWSDFHDTDSDGDSYNPASRDWTYLCQRNREDEHEAFEIEAIAPDSLVFEIIADSEFLGNRVAFLLARETDGCLLDAHGNEHPLEWIKDKLGNDFDLAAALNCADRSIWRKSTLDLFLVYIYNNTAIFNLSH